MTVRMLMGYILKQKPALIAALLCAIISQTLTLFIPTMTGEAIDAMVGAGRVDFAAIAPVVLWILAFTGAILITHWMVSQCANALAAGVAYSLRRDAVERLNALPIRFFDTHAHGDIVSRLTNDADAVSEGLLQSVTQMLTGVVTLIGTFIFMWRLSVPVTLLVLLATPLSILIARYIMTRSASTFRAQAALLGELSGLAEECVSGHEVMTAYQGADDVLRRFNAINQRLYEQGQKAQFYSSLVNPATRFVNRIVYLAVGVAGVILAMQGQATVGVVAAFLTYATQFAKPINEITGVLTQLQAALASAERLRVLIVEEPEPSDDGLTPFTPHTGAVSFDHLDFSYDGVSPTIKGFSMDVAPGQTVAIVGRTGSGKTTVINLLMRFYDPMAGRIAIDGRALDSIRRDDARHSFGMVLQEPVLFTATIHDNVAYGKPDATREQVINACKAAHAHSFITRLPDGYDTVLTGGGSALSQGQKQLLTIARAMLAGAPMLILDEATSSVDVTTEQRIQRAFLKMTEGRTAFVVAHRLSTIRSADAIIVMEKGEIVEAGGHEELLSKGGAYARLLGEAE